MRCSDYAKKKLLYIGSGSGRDVYLLSPNSIVKFAKTNIGRLQNAQEFIIGNDDRFAGKIVTKVFDCAQDHSWIVSELACPFYNIDEFEEKIMTMRVYSALLRYMKRASSLDEALKKMLEKEGYALTAFPLLCHMFELLHAYRLMVPDLYVMEHYGTTPDGRILLLDYGYTS